MSIGCSKPQNNSAQKSTFWTERFDYLKLGQQVVEGKLHLGFERSGRSRACCRFGGICYTIYLYHSLLISILVRLTLKLSTHVVPLDLAIQFVLIAAILVAVCAVLFAFLERPFMRRDWPQKLAEKLRRHSSAANTRE